MAVTRNTPVLEIRGTWALTMPFKVTAGVLYTCTAMAKFAQLVTDNVDVYKTYYEPLNITEEKYREDLAAGAVLVTLYSDTGSEVNVPDTYIESFPGIGMSNWGQAIVSFSLGPIKLTTNLDYLKASVANTVSDTFGIEPEIFIDLIDGSTALTQEQADAIEAARQSTIKNRTTPYAENIALKAELVSTRAALDALIAATKK